jgi:hypothetical protein
MNFLKSLRKVVDPVDHHGRHRAEQDRQHHAAKDHGHGPFLVALAGLGQLCCASASWLSCSTFSLSRKLRIASVVSLRRRSWARFGPLRGNARLQLLAPLVQRLHALVHGVAHAQRQPDRHQHHHGDAGQNGAQRIDIEAVKLRMGLFEHGVFPRAFQISKLTILAMMNTPMPIQSARQGR